MAVNDILAQGGDAQDFIVELPAGNVAYYPADILTEDEDPFLCTEIPIVEVGEGGGNIFIMSE